MRTAEFVGPGGKKAEGVVVSVAECRENQRCERVTYGLDPSGVMLDPREMWQGYTPGFPMNVVPNWPRKNGGN